MRAPQLLQVFSDTFKIGWFAAAALFTHSAVGKSLLSSRVRLDNKADSLQ